MTEIAAKNIAARGGEARIRAIQTLKQTGHLTISGMQATFTLYKKRPNRMRNELSIAGANVVAAFDGTNAWAINPPPGQPPSMLTGASAEPVKRQADFDPPLLDYKTRGTRVELVGTETLNGAQVYHLKLTNKDGMVVQCYLDARTGLEAKFVGDSPNGPAETVLGDYRDVNGLKIPFSAKTSIAGTVVSDLVVDKCEIRHADRGRALHDAGQALKVDFRSLFSHMMST